MSCHLNLNGLVSFSLESCHGIGKRRFRARNHLMGGMMNFCRWLRFAERVEWGRSCNSRGRSYQSGRSPGGDEDLLYLSESLVLLRWKRLKGD